MMGQGHTRTDDDRTPVAPGADRAASAWGVRGLWGLTGRIAAACVVWVGRPTARRLLGGAAPALRYAASSSFLKRAGAAAAALGRSCAAARADVPWLAAAAFVVLPSFLFFLCSDAPLRSGDSWPVLPTAYQLLRGGAADLTPMLPLASPDYVNDTGLPYCVRRAGRRIYSAYPAGMVPFALPVAAVCEVLRVSPTSPAGLNRLEHGIAAGVAALALGFFFLAARELGNAAAAGGMTFILAVGSVFATICGQGLWQQSGVVFWALVVLFVELRRERFPVRGALLVQGLACGMMFACRPSAALFIGPFLLWSLVRGPSRGLLLAGWSAVVYLPWAAIYFRMYGTVWGPAVGQLNVPGWGAHTLGRLAGVLFSPGRGLFVYHPWLLLMVGAFWPRRSSPAAMSGGPKGWRWFCLTFVVLQVLLASLWRCWWGGYCWGPRLVAEVVPVGALLCLGPLTAAWATGRGRAVVVAAVLLAFLLQAPALYFGATGWDGAVGVDDNPNALWSWSHPPFLYPLQRSSFPSAGQ